MLLLKEVKTVVFLKVYICSTFLLFFFSTINAQSPFITVWQTDMPGISEDNQILIPGTGSGYTIEWEEENNPSNSGALTGENAAVVSFPHPGVYRVSIAGDFTRIQMNAGNDSDKLLVVEQWGDIEWENMSGAFSTCVNLEIDASDTPNLSKVKDMGHMFAFCTNFNSPIGHWDLSNVENLEGMFISASSFDQPIGTWDVSNVSSMRSLFHRAESFNQDISMWDVSNVRDMTSLFQSATSFNQPLNNWNVSNVEVMIEMFHGAQSFNQPLDKWDVSSVLFMGNMLSFARSFDQSIGNWNLNSLISLSNALSLSGLSCSTYDTTLMGWYSNPNTPNNINLGASGLQYRESLAVRDSLIHAKGWEITGDEFAPCDCALFFGPEIGLDGPEFLCDGDSTLLFSVFNSEEYRWFRDGELLAEETDPELWVTEAGEYTLQYLDEYTCESGLSQALVVGTGGANHPPVMTNSGEQKINSLVGNCEGYAYFEAEIQSCGPRSEIEKRSEWKIDLFKTGRYEVFSSEVADGDNLIIDLPLPLGQHRVHWLLVNEYGEESQHEVLLRLVDRYPPEPICYHGLSTSLASGGEVQLSAWMFDAGSRDDCTEQSNLSLSFSSDPAHGSAKWTCDDLNGEPEAFVPVELWVTNEYGNQNYCTTYLLLKDSRESCATAGSITPSVSGQVSNAKGMAVEDVTMELSGNSGMPLLQRSTNQLGTYDFGTVEGDYTSLSAKKEGEIHSGLSTLDVLLIQKHILGVQPLESPYDLIAADVNRDGGIDVLDVQEIRRVLLGNATGFSQSKNWIFLPDHTFERSGEVPDYSELLTIDPASTEQGKYYWTAVKTGDVNHSHKFNGVENRSVEEVIEMVVKEVNAGERTTIELAFLLEEEIDLEGVQLSFQFDQAYLGFRGFESGEMILKEGNFGFGELSEGKLSMSWSAPSGIKIESGSPLFVLKFHPIKEDRNWSSLQIDRSGLKPEVYTAGYKQPLRPELKIPGKPELSNLITHVYPNPFSTSLSVEIELEQPSEVQLRVVAMSGAVLWTQNKWLEPGSHQVKIDGSRIPSSGMYLFSLSTGENKYYRRVMFVE